jgi:DNA polymerase-3 subunit epsilon
MDGREKTKKIMSMLKLKRPLVIFELKTTGIAVSSDKIFEIAYLKIFPNGRVREDSFYLNPETELSDISSVIHNIENEDLLKESTFRQKSKELWDIFYDCFYCGFSIVDFDLLILRREFIRLGLDFYYSSEDIIDLKVIFNYMEPRTLSVAYKHFCNKEHISVHHAKKDVEVIAEILEAQVNKYEEIRSINFINEIHGFRNERATEHESKFYWRKGEAYFNFSKYKDSPLSEIAFYDPEFLEWILGADFSSQVKNIVRKALRRAGH